MGPELAGRDAGVTRGGWDPLLFSAGTLRVTSAAQLPSSPGTGLLVTWIIGRLHPPRGPNSCSDSR